MIMMFKKIMPALALAMVLTLSLTSSKRADVHEERTIEVNGVTLHYAVDGPAKGRPILLVHGNGGSHHSLDSLSFGLQSRGYLVYGIDSRGQGANVPLDEYHYRDMAEDMYQLIRALHLRRPAMFGHSDGGIIGLQLEIMHPRTLRLLAAAGANIFPEGVGEEKLASWRAKVEKTGSALTRMLVEEPQILPEELAAVRIPVLVTAGENDLILEEHTRLIADSLPNAELVIVKDAGHSNYIKKGTRMLDLLTDFMKRNHYR